MNRLLFFVIPMFFSCHTIANSNCSAIRANGDINGNGGINEVIRFGKINVQSDAPIGTVLATMNSNASGGFYCNPGPTEDSVSYYWMPYNSVSMSQLPGVLATPNPGIGLRATLTDTGEVIDKNNVIRTEKLRPGANYVGRVPQKFELVKTGEIVSTDKLNFFSVGVTMRTTENVLGLQWDFSSSSGSVVVIAPACQTMAQTINIPMGKLLTSDFSGPGTAGPVKQFSIPIKCTAAAKVSVTVDASSAGTFDGITGVLKLINSTSSASGVGIQLLRNNQPVTFNSPIAMGDMLPGNESNLTFSARYIQTHPVVLPGEANSVATLLMKYE